jgi:glycerophosphoryl diester phosphodiesterase
MTKLQAHRGVSYEYPENTIIAYQAAVDQGYGIIELDPKYTSDGKIVMLHDKSLKRTARDENGEAPELNIADITLDEARSYEYGSWKNERFKGEKIPTLSEVLDFAEENPTVPLKFDNVWTTFPEEIPLCRLPAIVVVLVSKAIQPVAVLDIRPR